MKGHKDHESRLHHHGVHKRAHGGNVLEQKGPHQEETNEKTEEKMLHPDKHDGKERGHEKEEVEKKKGGRIKRKRGGKVPGHEAKHRLDKRARGGEVSPKHPLSGGDAPNLSYAHGNLKAGGEGKGKDPI